MSRTFALAVLSLALLAGTAHQAFAANERAATLVFIKTPAGLTRAQIDAGIQASVQTYQKISSLKYITVNADGFGGMYLWTNRAAADAWYAPAWATQCTQRYGTECQVTWFDTPVQIDGLGANQ